jgi:hypothetical protein
MMRRPPCRARRLVARLGESQEPSVINNWLAALYQVPTKALNQAISAISTASPAISCFTP